MSTCLCAIPGKGVRVTVHALIEIDNGFHPTTLEFRQATALLLGAIQLPHPQCYEQREDKHGDYHQTEVHRLTSNRCLHLGVGADVVFGGSGFGVQVYFPVAVHRVTPGEYHYDSNKCHE